MSRRRRGTVVVLLAVVLSTGFAATAAAQMPGGATSAGRPVVSLRPVDGGVDYTKRFTSSLPAGKSFFPIGVWFESVTARSDIAEDKAAGINTYVQLTDTSRLSLLRGSGMQVISSDAVGHAQSGVEGWFVSDEADMRFGPGSQAVEAGKDPDRCASANLRCGYTYQQNRGAQLPDDRRLRYANYGKGVMFWESDAEARVFVNRFQDIVSADTFWFTDPNICGTAEGGAYFANGRELPEDQCRRAANYGKTIDRMRALVRPAGSKPVWGFVEVGHPFDEDSAPTISPAEIHAAVWSSLIHGARGIIYFNHSFAGECPTYHALREPCYAAARAEVTATNAQITELAPVLNAPTVTGATRALGEVDTLTKWSGGTYYVFAGSTASGAGVATFDLACTGGATATVLGENRSIPVVDGQFHDDFADGNAVHLYRIDGGTTCEPS